MDETNKLENAYEKSLEILVSDAPEKEVRDMDGDDYKDNLEDR
jgi:hypothetical protein